MDATVATPDSPTVPTPRPITAPALRALLGTPHGPLVIDVRKPPAFDADRRTIPAALRRAHDAVDRWAPLRDRR